ncbi:hypothetical protein M409DRAFT_64807 [Zasmidium cellare ATCC 36951]|uniref:Uncharacterized protein n=1 Tax=Zasmidium cellare ATCC 36951 TaxID=1080233 RepID=A0A6A6CVF9_ZASCE|nr:uncharacterized protein M409DRAFT_64807 [Zasmidium cellare ATCC 36951]KAF2169802.1 hypothetical protein M409DRAFT_64807 [Zasmidium cellare ATCC 36951]
MAGLATLLDKFNPRIPFGRWQLFEFADLWIIPPFIKHDQQDALSARWTKKLITLPQDHTPAELLADIVETTLSDLSSSSQQSSSTWTVVDVGSGTGGPLPIIDRLVNHGRTELGQNPIQFLLSDLHPHLDSWMRHASRSETLSFVPQAVDARNPPFSVISSTTEGDKEAAYLEGLESNGTKVFRLFASTFHHFDDETARRVLKSSLETSDGFAVVELQERTIFSLVMVLLENWLLLLMAVFWFWNDPVHLFFTYCVPVLPVTQCLDGLVTCLRIRSFDEVLRLLPKQYEYSRDKIETEKDGEVVELRDWQFEHTRVLHTWPFGYMNIIVGTCSSSKDGIR